MGTQLQKEGSTESKSESSKPTIAPPPPDFRRWITVAETAACIGVSLHHAYRMHRRGQLPSFKLPGTGIRIDRKALEEKFRTVIEARARATGVTWPV